MSYIRSFAYKEKDFDKIGRYKYGKNWPVVYILEGDKEAYVGETVKADKRSRQHYRFEERRRLSSMHLISDDQFNKSAIMDIESLLIQFMSADGKYKLQNGNAGLRNHAYYDKAVYHGKFELIWEEMRQLGLADKDLIRIKNSDLFKFSPYKALTDDQYQVVLNIVMDIKKQSESKHLIVGEPGSGKSVVAVFLVKYLKEIKAFQDKEIGLVVPMTSLRETLRKVFKEIKGLKANMVLGPNDVVKKNYDILIVDEAHRLTGRKGIQNIRAFDTINQNLGLNTYTTTQLDWVTQFSKHTILLYDKNQTIKPADLPQECYGTFEAVAKKHELTSQLRVQGGHDYIQYVENILHGCQSEKKEFEDYEFTLFDNLRDMIGLIKKRNKQTELARLVAGFAWEWGSKKDKDIKDIQIGDIKLRWNSVTKDWVNSEDALHEVGCIHTIQGYDLNYTGVIIGPEFQMTDGVFTVDKSHYKDQNGKKGVDSPEQLLAYIRNIYKILLTRGIKGTYVYACDPGLRDYLKAFINCNHTEESIYKNTTGIEPSRAADSEEG